MKAFRRSDMFSRVQPPTPVFIPDEEDEEERLAEQATTEEIVANESATREANGDDLDDLFRGPSSDAPDIATDDLVRVDDEDVYGEGGEDMSDLLEVSDEDIMGEDIEEPEPPPQPRYKAIRKIKRTGKRYPTIGSMGGMRP